MDGYINRPI